MKEVFIVSDNITSPLGINTEENFSMLKKDVSGIRQHEDHSMCDQPFYASLFEKDAAFTLSKNTYHTKFEKLLIASVQEALESCPVDITDKKTVLIISSTKGNISLIETGEINDALKTRVALHTSAGIVARHFSCANQPIVISNACISGSLGLLIGKRLIQSNEYDHAVVVGADVISKFVLSGFQSFQAMSAEPCKPFDINRSGINLGEGAATIVLSSRPEFSRGIKIKGGATSNDANHISGPSRTGIELCHAIKTAMKESDLTTSDIDYISAHGTATLYNDEMEAQAITRAHLQDVPLNSLKGFYGHTLGAAGIIESVIAIRSLQQNIILPSKGFNEPGVSRPLNINKNKQEKSLTNCLKTASGFGGCNAALIFGE